MPLIEPSRVPATDHSRGWSPGRSAWLLILVISVAAVLSCSSDGEPTTLAVTAKIGAESTPETETTVQNGEVAADEALATAFDEWGSTCLNEVYPPHAPQLEDVDASDSSEDTNGLMFVTIKEGQGDQPELEWEVDVQYTGWLDNGCIFDSSYTRSEPTIFPVGGVIPGWQMTLTQMKVGERRRVVIPPDLAYGPTGSPPVIPENATLTFDIILVSATNPNIARAEATKVADELFTQATMEAEQFHAETAKFEPILVDYVTDIKGFLDSLPKGEVTCMTAYAGGKEALEELFVGRSRTPLHIVENFDECLSDHTTRNINAGRISILGPDLSNETMSCIQGELKNPTLKPLFGIFDTTQVSEEWITAHFCLTTEERTAFEEILLENQPGQERAGSGKTFIDVQECMVEELGATKYFEPVAQPNNQDTEAMRNFFKNFTAFMIADIRCRQGDDGHQLNDGTMMSEDAAICVADALGDARFGEIFLDRVWVPTVEEHAEAASAYNQCGVETDFLDLPASIGNLEGPDMMCLLGELVNHENPREASLRAYADIGARNDIKTGDLVALMFGMQSCGIELPGTPDSTTVSDEAAMCITSKIDKSLIPQGRTAVIPAFDQALKDSADCFPDQ